MKTCVGKVPLDSVLAALSDCAKETRDEAEKHAHWYEWIFDRASLGTVGDQDKLDPSIIGSVSVIHERRLFWMKTAEAAAIVSREKHERFVRMLRAGENFGWVVVHSSANGDRHILDGAHRIHAAYEFAATHPGCTVKVYWTTACP